MKSAVLLRAALATSGLALVPATTAGLAAVDARSGPQFARLNMVYQLVKAQYVEQVDDTKLINGAIEGMLASLDPHSAYLEGNSLERLNTMMHGDLKRALLRFSTDGRASKTDE